MTSEVQANVDTIEVLARLLRSELGFPDTPPRVFVYNTTWNIPSEEWMFLVIGMLHDRTIGHSLRYDYSVENELVENQATSRLTRFTVDVFSVNYEARRRYPEILFALQGQAAEQVSEKYNFRIGRPTDFLDLSHLEASRRLNRFQTEFTVTEASVRRRNVDYFDKFSITPEITVNP